MSRWWLVPFPLLFLLALALSACYEEKLGTAPSLDESSSYVVVGCGLSETLSLLEVSRDGHLDVQNDVQKTCQAISELKVRGDRVYGLCSLSNSLIVYDRADLSVITEHALGERKNPISFCFDGEGRLWTSNFVAETVEVYEFSSDGLSIVRSFDVSGATSPGSGRPGGMECAGSRVFAVLSNLDDDFLPAGDSALAVFDADALEEVGVFEIRGKDAIAAVFREDDGLVYVTCAGDYEQGDGFVGDGRLVAFDPEAQKESWSMDISGAPFELVLWRNLAIMGNGAEGKILVADIEARAELDPVDIRTGGHGELSYVSALAIASSDMLVAAEFNSDKLFVFDLNGFSRLAGFSTCDGPDTLAVME